MAIRYYKTGGKRYYVIGVTGYNINPSAFGTSSAPPTTAYSVLDRDWNHRELSRFVPFAGRSEKKCQRAAYDLAAELNAEEAAA